MTFIDKQAQEDSAIVAVSLFNEKGDFKKSIPEIEAKYNIKILLAFVRGSHMYGTATPKSDVDITFIYIQPTNQILMDNYKHYIDITGTGDIVGHEIKKYLELMTENNPTMLETLDIPEECLIYKHPSMETLLIQNTWITKLTEKTILGYGKSQVKKATGLNKNMNNPQPEKRNSILHYCYILDGAKSIPFLDWYDTYCSYNSRLEPEFLDHNNWGLAKIENGKGLFALYLNELDGDNFAGLIKDDNSTQLRLSSVPKKNMELRKEIYHFYYNLDGFEVHCKQHKSYWEWVNKRNQERFKMNQEAGQNIDLKNMSHLFRLLEMALNISQGKGVIVRSGTTQFLQDIKQGVYKYEYLIEESERLTNEIKGNFESVDLPESVDLEKIKKLLLRFRLNVGNF